MDYSSVLCEKTDNDNETFTAGTRRKNKNGEDDGEEERKGWGLVSPAIDSFLSCFALAVEMKHKPFMLTFPLLEAFSRTTSKSH